VRNKEEVSSATGKEGKELQHKTKVIITVQQVVIHVSRNEIGHQLVLRVIKHLHSIQNILQTH
jgi:hypothetical protein